MSGNGRLFFGLGFAGFGCTSKFMGTAVVSTHSEADGSLESGQTATIEGAVLSACRPDEPKRDLSSLMTNT